MKQDLTRTVLAIMLIGLLGLGSLWVLSPLLPALTWAAMIVVATWPVLLQVQKHLGNRRSLAVIVMVTLLLLVLIIPLMVAIAVLVKHADKIVDLPVLLSNMTLPPPPGWLMSVPFAGPTLTEKWQTFSSAGMAELSEYLKPYAGQLTQWFLSQMGSFGLLIVNFLLVVIISAVLYSYGETAANGVRLFARRLTGERGERSAQLAAQAVRAVALGIVVTALVQSILGGIGLAIAGVPYPAALTALMFMLGVAQIGAGPVLLLSSLWFFWQGETGWGIALFVWTIIVGSMDNFLRPWLIKRGADLPLILIFVGVIGGLITMGIIGLFIGPMVLAVTYELIVNWVKEGEPSP